MTRIFVLASRRDASAAMLTSCLEARRGAAVVTASTEALALAEWRWEPSSETPALVRLPDGTAIRPVEGDILVNRCAPPHLPHLQRGSEADATYAAAEMGALWLAWLSAQPQAGVRVINPPHPAGLTGLPAETPAWRWLASQAGFDLLALVAAVPGRIGGASHWPSRALSPAQGAGAAILPGSIAQVFHEPIRERRRLLVCNGACPDDEPVAATAIRLAQLARTPLLAVEIADAGEGPVFLAADPAPWLSAEEAEFVADRLLCLSSRRSAVA